MQKIYKIRRQHKKNIRKCLGKNQQGALHSRHCQAGTIRISTYIGYGSQCSEIHRKDPLSKKKILILKRPLKRGILSKSIRLLLILIQIWGFRKARSFVADWSYSTDKIIFTVWNGEKSVGISRCNEDFNHISYPFQRNSNFLLILARKNRFGGEFRPYSSVTNN